MFKKIKEDIQQNKWAIIIILAYFILMQLVFSTCCPIKAIFHIDCPGCGLTHATFYLLKGQWANAFSANYTVFFWWPLIFLFFIDRYVHTFKVKILFPFFIFVCCITLLRYALLFL